MILIGSQAIKYWYPDFPREPRDMDFIVSDSEVLPPKGDNVEYHKNPIFSNKFKYKDTKPLYPDDLIALKASHLCWDINWEKHMFDVQFLLKKGNQIDTDLFLELYEYWNEYHGKNKRSDLKMSKDDFFNNKVNYDSSEHDVTHTYLNPIPVYTRVLKDNSEVELDPNKFDNLSHEDKLNFVREEVMVMAYERYRTTRSFQHAYSKMLKKFIISHAPLFSLQFIIENFIELHIIKYNYFKIIENGINIRTNK